MCVLLFDVFNGSSTSIKEINSSLIWKGLSNIYYWEKLTFSKLRVFQKENLNKCTNFEEQKGTRYIRGNVYIDINVFSYLSSTKQCLRFLLNCFVQEIKGFYPSSFGNEVDAFLYLLPIILVNASRFSIAVYLFVLTFCFFPMMINQRYSFTFIVLWDIDLWVTCLICNDYA